jgi:hypothetical protein
MTVSTTSRCRWINFHGRGSGNRKVGLVIVLVLSIALTAAPVVQAETRSFGSSEVKTDSATGIIIQFLEVKSNDTLRVN